MFTPLCFTLLNPVESRGIDILYIQNRGSNDGVIMFLRRSFYFTTNESSWWSPGSYIYQRYALRLSTTPVHDGVFIGLIRHALPVAFAIKSSSCSSIYCKEEGSLREISRLKSRCPFFFLLP